jgi:DNA-binding NarL/FixJ family response regulator
MCGGRVVIVCAHQLIGRGIAHLLESTGQLDVCCLRADTPDLAERLRCAQPDVVIVEGCDATALSEELFRTMPPLLVIGVHPQHNVAQVHYGWQMPVTSVDDLVNVIQRSVAWRAAGDVPWQEREARTLSPGMDTHIL